MSGAAALCRRLDWDSAFFALPVARVEAAVLDDAAAMSAIAWCRQEGIRCLYYLAPLEVGPMRVAERHGFQAMDARVVLARACERTDPPSDVPIRAYQAADLPALRAIARAAFRGTRFDADPRFPLGRAADLYEVWLERSCTGWAAHVLVAAIDGAAAGFVTVHDDGGGAWRIGLIGVAEAARGRRAGRALVAAAVDAAAGAGGRTMSVATQGANVAAQRLYQRAGFLTSTVHVWYHRWFEVTSS